jgi:hypothetical protein
VTRPVRHVPTRPRDRWPYDRELCAKCGLLRINVRHERDPEHAPEGRAYYDDMRDVMHEFEPSGRYAP